MRSFFAQQDHMQVFKLVVHGVTAAVITISALLYIAAFPCIPNCLGVMSQLINGDHVIKLERKSFRVQLCLGAAMRRCGMSLSAVKVQ